MIDSSNPTAEANSAPAPTFRLSVIIPARNEATNLPACLASLIAQSDSGFALGTEWELLIVDDDSTDTTRAIANETAAQHAGITVLAAPPLDLGSHRGFTGKTNACWAAAQQARGAWMLFTDADTIHEPGNLSRAIHEAEKYHAALLSYSPRQIVTGFWQRALMPLVFSELASVYPPKQVSDPNSRLAAANGQFLLIACEAYFAIGGHRAVGREVLEDVALANTVKRRKLGLRFRYAPDALSTRMYRTLPEMIEGWTKNLALLFPSPVALALWRILDVLLFFGLPIIALVFIQDARPLWQPTVVAILWVRTLFRFYNRVARSHFPAADIAISILGGPLFVWLLLRSTLHNRLRKSVSWKGRSYTS